MNDSPLLSRRAALATVGTAATSALAGCMDRLWTTAEPSPYEQISLTIMTPPRDDDSMSVAIAGQLAANLRAAGIDALHEPVESSELFRQTLLNADYDVFVARHPGFDEPDSLYGTLHSSFFNEAGWQNPFRFTDDAVDDALAAQRRRSGANRRSAFADAFDALDGAAPYTTVAFPHHRTVARPALELSAPPRTPLDYLELAANADEGADSMASTLRVGVLEHGLDEGLNPIAIDLGDLSPLVGLLYDPLVRRSRTGRVPWLAETVEWAEIDGGSRIEATATLRDGTTWHDGTKLDAGDVAFTVRFLQDTALDGDESPIPAPRYRSRTSLIDSATAESDRRVRFVFSDSSMAVAKRALTIPILPEHVWTDLAEPIHAQLTEAIEWPNQDPIGSGPYAFVDASEERVEIEPYDDHALQGAAVEGLDGVFEGSLSTSLEFRSSPNAGSAIESIRESALDLVCSRLGPNGFEHVADGDDVSILETSTRSFYIVGYHLRHPELALPQFRRLVSRLIDREQLVEEILDGHADVPTTVAGVLGMPPDVWDLPERIPETTLDFPGDDGEVDEETVRGLFEHANFRYDDGELVA